ncbi:hypothetical protein [Halorhodospira neutriphila]|uniref:hypothetical protein n=1 Tax=Halorhodospira neutriphila TaxID=168379 RepID=UPI00190746C2|nr:hypothetical protein [Halorhodospira neutriphila]
MSGRLPRRPLEWAERILAEPRRAERRRLLAQVPGAYRETVRRVVEREFQRRRKGRS